EVNGKLGESRDPAPVEGADALPRRASCGGTPHTSGPPLASARVWCDSWGFFQPAAPPVVGGALGGTSMQEYKLYIDGQFCDAEGGKTADSINPATEEPWAKIARATRKDTQRAIEAA